MVSLLREGSSKGTVGSLDSLEFYIILTKKIVVPLKILEKKWGHFFFWTFLKCPFFKMRLLNFTKKVKTSFLLGNALNTKKIVQKLLS